MDTKQLMHVMNCKNAYEMWRKLRTIYERNTEQQKCNLLQEFFSYTYDKKGDIAAHVSKLESIAYRLGKNIKGNASFKNTSDATRTI